MTTPYERRCLALLRAYPPRYRAARGTELLGTLLDAATPGRDTPSVRESWDVIRGGLLTRWRARPPVWRWAAYRGFGARLPYAYRWWARDDVLGRWYRVRSRLGSFLVFVPCSYGVTAVIRAFDSVQYHHPYNSPLPHGDGWWWLAIACAALALIPIPPTDERNRRGVLKKHEFFPDGTPFEAAPMWGWTWPPQAPPASPPPTAPTPSPSPAVPGSWPPMGSVPASWPPMVPPVAARTRRPQHPDDRTSGPWWPPQ
jgi:hypothetical protein